MEKPPFFRSLALASSLFLTACVPSVNPLYSADTIVFRPELVGVWKDKPEAEGSWNFAKLGDNAYTLVVQEKESSSKFNAHLLKLGETFFLDMSPAEEVLEKSLGEMYRVALIPGHLIAKVKLGKTLEIQMLDPDGIQKFLEGDPKALMHSFPDKQRLVLTAPTDALQNFFQKHAHTGTLWGDPGVLHKIQL